MKKLLFVALAAVGLASCVQTEELAVANNNQAIGFDTFVDNVTKTLYDNSNLDHFNVYGTITADNGGLITNIFPGVEVSNATGVWAYGSQYTQYWIPGFTYNFAAVVDGDVDVDTTTGMPTTISTDMTAQNDVLYSTESRHFGTNDTAAKVSFQFAHLLSKAKFTVKNGIVNGQNFVYNVESIKIKNADKDAKYDVALSKWTATNTYEASFGAINAIAQTDLQGKGNDTEVLLVPGTKELAIEIAYKLTYNNALLKEEAKNLTAVLTLEQGKAYNFVVEFGAPGEDIKFDAQVKDWTEGGDVTPGTSYVATAEEFTTAIAADGIDRIVLAGDLDLTAGATRAAADPSFVIANGKELTIELGGHKLYAASTASNDNFDLFLVKGNLTVSNGTIEYKHNGTNMGWNHMTTIFDITGGGVVNLNGVTAKNLGGSDMGFVAHLNNWGEVTLNAENCVLESSPYVAVRVFNSGYDMNNVTIKNSTLKGANYALWVHNYTAADFGGSETKAESQKALLNFNFEGSTFVPNVNGVRYGFTNSVKADIMGITHSISEDGTEVTLGSIAENGVVRRGVVGTEENNTIKKVVVGEGITTLYDRTFRRFYALETVELPAGLTAIGVEGSGVFQSCTNLKNIVIPESVTVLGKGSFQECASLESINIPAGVTRIEENCLRATGLVKVEFHEGVTYFGAQAFRDCKQLKEVVINAPQFTVEASAFGVMAGALPGTTIYVANAKMKAYLESTLAYKNQFTVVAPSVASTTEQLTEALTNGETRVHLAAGTYTMPASSKFSAETVLTCEEGVVFEGQSGLNINGATIIGATFKNEGGVAVSGTINGTLKNCTFEGEEALRWCYSEAGKTVVFENCVINNNFRGFHFDDMKGDVLFKNCHINGFNAYGGEGTATFEGCTFGTDDRSRYNGLNIYANTVLTDCTFIYKSGKTNFIDLEAAGKSMTITNCTATLDGVAVDVADYVGGSKLPECTVTIDGETIVSDAASLKKAIINGGNIAFAKDITVDEWIMFSEDLNISNGTIITIDNINVSIDGKGHTLTVNTIKSGGNNDQLFQGASVLNISNLTIQYADGLTAGGLGMDSGVIKNVHFIGGGSASSSAAIFPHNGVIKVEDCIFDTNGVALYFDDECDNLSVTRCTFNQKDNKNVILLRGDVKFTDNTINSGRTVNVVSGSPVVTGNNFNNVRFKVYGAATATISNNIINNLEFDGTTYASTFSGNTLSDAAQAALNAATKVN